MGVLKRKCACFFGRLRHLHSQGRLVVALGQAVRLNLYYIIIKADCQSCRAGLRSPLAPECSCEPLCAAVRCEQLLLQL